MFLSVGLCETYSVLGQISNQVQKSENAPWEVSGIINGGLETLKRMSDSVNPASLCTTSVDGNLFPTLSSIVAEVTEK